MKKCVLSVFIVSCGLFTHLDAQAPDSPSTNAELRARVVRLEQELAGLQRDYQLLLSIQRPPAGSPPAASGTVVAPAQPPAKIPSIAVSNSTPIPAGGNVAYLGGQAVVVPTPSDDPVVGAAVNMIRNKCAKDWPEDFRMREFCQTQQVEALGVIAARNDAGTLKTPDGQVIRAKCLREWLDDFRMMNYCVEQQLKALGALGR